MKFSENWLRTFVNPSLSSDELAHRLTMAGLEVEALEPAGAAFTGVVVAEVLTVEKHPDADRLQVCRVSVGDGEPLQIVCGAKNVHAGARVPCARVGAELPGIKIKQAKVRGVDSSGMLCSAKELGLAEESDGLFLLPADAPVGEDIRCYLDLDDTLFTLKLTPNRSDCLSLGGIAREVAAITASSLAWPEAGHVEVQPGASVSVAVEVPLACPRYCGRVIRGVDLAASTPEWMVRRLERSGVRSINAVVDVTNYVMLEQGQPLHAFDLAKFKGGVTVRFARAGETLRLLNEETAELAEDMLIIADAEKPLAVAGVMGGLDSAVSGGSADIFLESAFFSPDAIAGRARRLGLNTDSAYRFERGVDFGATRDCLDRATGLIQSICGGLAEPVTEIIGDLPKREPIQLRAERVRRILGVELDLLRIEELLRREQLTFVAEGDVYFVAPPTYRFDLNLEVDLVEELARLYGYDQIPGAAPSAPLHMLPQTESCRTPTELRHFLAARDYQEVVNYSFVEAQWERDFAGHEPRIRLKNPIASHMGVMRSTLFGGLVDSLRFNLNRRQERVRIFEIGRCFFPEASGEASLSSQPARLGGLCYGLAKPEQWGEKARWVDFYDVKADVESLCWPTIPRFSAASHPAMHPGQTAQVWLGEQLLGWVGVLHPQWQQKYDLPQAPVLFELDLARLMERPLPTFSEFSKFPQVRRDIAVVVDEKVNVFSLLDALREAAPDIVTEVQLFDVYRGKGIDSDKKSLAFRVLMQDTQKTLTDDETEGAVAALTQMLSSRFDAKLRA